MHSMITLLSKEFPVPMIIAVTKSSLAGILCYDSDVNRSVVLDHPRPHKRIVRLLGSCALRHGDRGSVDRVGHVEVIHRTLEWPWGHLRLGLHRAKRHRGQRAIVDPLSDQCWRHFGHTSTD